MITQGSWMINSFYTAEHASDYAWAMIPYADVNGNGACDKGERYSAYNGLGWAANAGTKDPNAAYSLISYFCSEEGQKMQSELGVTMAGMIGASDAFANAFACFFVRSDLWMAVRGGGWICPAAASLDDFRNAADVSHGTCNGI